MDIRAIAHLGRFREILSTLIKYGFDDVVDRLDVPGRKYLEKIRVHTMHLTRWERMRMVLEELGPTYIKCGQILSQRADLLPRELLDELRKLQDDVPAEEFSEIRKVLKENFDQPLEEIFSEIEETPIAAASLAQVHKARLKGSNQEVALKIQRPDIAETIKSDMDILERIAIRLDGRMESFKVYNLPQLVQRIKKLMLQELNFVQEMRNMQVVRMHITPQEKILVPQVYPELCGELVITMELSRGSKMKDVRIGELKNRAGLAKRGLNFSIRQVLEHGFFHADPHPGNILIDEDENMILLDWGMVGRLTNKVRYELIDLIGAVVDNDVEEVTEILISFTTGRENVNRSMLQNEVLEVVSHFTRLPLKEVNLG
uniref:ABC1 kinase family protein n=1 Tax=Desulfonatronospira sp. TaxID=1962951 RepID=UPI0025BC6001